MHANSIQEKDSPIGAKKANSRTSFYHHVCLEHHSLRNNQPCAATDGRALSIRHVDELIPDRLVRRLTVKEFEGVVRLSSLAFFV
jgi:hypothetical protein